MRTKSTLTAEKVTALVNFAKEIGANTAEIRQAAKDLFHGKLEEKKQSQANVVRRQSRVNKMKEHLESLGLGHVDPKSVVVADVLQKEYKKADGNLSKKFWAKVVFRLEDGRVDTRKIPSSTESGAWEEVKRIITQK